MNENDFRPRLKKQIQTQKDNHWSIESVDCSRQIEQLDKVRLQKKMVLQWLACQEKWRNGP